MYLFCILYSYLLLATFAYLCFSPGFDIPVLFKFLIMFSLGVIFLIVLRLLLSFKKVNFKAIGLTFWPVLVLLVF